MEKINIYTTSGIIRSINYTIDQNPKIHKDLAILYLTVLFRTSRDYEIFAPIPIWFFGLKNWRDYLSFFNRTNLIYKKGNSFSCSHFLGGQNAYYETKDLEKIENLANEVFELRDHLTIA